MVEVTTKMIGEWYKEHFESLAKSIPIKERRIMATKRVQALITLHKQIIPLDEYLPFYPYQKNALRKEWGKGTGTNTD